MALAGVKTDNISNKVSVSDEVLVNRAGSTGVQEIDDLAAQIAGTGPIADAIDTVALRVDATEAGLSSVNDEISALETAISSIETGNAEGIIVEATKANLDARATALGLGAANAGRAGRVYQDATTANNGDYRWTGTAWSYLGLDRIGQAESRLQSLVRRTAQLSCNREIIIDRKGLLGGGPAAYVPDLLRLVVGDATVVAKNLTPDAKMTLWHKVTIADTADLQTIYLDLQDAGTPVKVASAMPVDADRYFHIVSTYGSTQGYAGANRVVSTEEWNSTFVSTRPLVYDASEGKLFIPTLQGMRSGSLYWNLLPLADTDALREVSVPVSGSATFVWLDVYACFANPRSADAVVVSQGYSNRPVRESSVLLLLGIAFGRYFTPAHPDLRVANIVPSQFGAGREDNDLADLIFPGSSPVDLVRPESLALGFTRGYSAPTSFRPYYGGSFPQARTSGMLFYRFFVETDVADDFATPRGYLHKRNADGTTSYTLWNASLEKKHSPYLAEYSGYVAMADAIYKGFWAGVDGATHGGIRIFGVQFHAGTTQDSWIAKKDYPRSSDEIGARLRRLEAGGGAITSLDPVVPPLLYVHPDRPWRIYADQMFGAESRGAYRMTVQSLDAAYKPLFSREVAGGTLDLPTEGLGSTLEFHYQNAGDRGSRKSASAAVRMLSPSAIASISPKLLFLGDSITDWNGAAVQPVRRLQDMGATVATVGTMNQSSSISGDGQVLGEGRSSRRMSDFYGLTQDRMVIIEEGQEAGYLALDTAGKREWNPFLKIASAADLTDRPNMVVNGNIFDMRYYLDRFGLADPDVVIINLATNDYGNETAEVAAEHVATGLNILVSQTRRALPGAKIVLVYNTRGYGTASDAYWAGGFRSCLGAYLKFVLETDDEGVVFVPGYCTVNRLTGFSYNLAADPETGLSSGALSDGTHYSAAGLREYGEIVAQFIAGVLTE